MKRKRLIFLLLLGAGVGGWFWWHRSPAPAATESVEPVASVTVTPLRRQPIAQTIEAFGTVAPAPSGERVIAAAYDCVVQRVQVASGARVVAGEVLMEVAPSPDAALALASARAAESLAGKALASTQQRYDLKLATRQDLLAAQQAEREARLQLQSYRDRGLTGDGRIVAPVAGIVDQLDLTAGSVVLTGGALIKLATDQQTEVHLQVEPDDVGRIATGDPVTLTTADRSGGPPIETRVIATGGAVDTAAGSALVRVALPAGERLLLGERVRAAITVKQEDGLVVPRSAVLPDGDQQVLFTVQAGRAVRHEVTMGITAGDRVEIRGEGLHPGDSVVTLGNYELEDGMSVQVAPPPNATATPAETGR